MSATHLIFLECQLLVRSDACWTLYSFAGFGFDRSQNFGQVGHTFQCELEGAAFQMKLPNYNLLFFKYKLIIFRYF